MNVFTEHVQFSRAAQREITRQKVLASAQRLFATNGFAATTVRQIAADAQVSVGTVMAVGDKEALLVTSFDSWIAAVHRERSADPEPTAATPLPAERVADAVVDLFRPFLERFTRDQALAREYAAILMRGAHESTVFRQLAAALLAEIETQLRRSALPPGAVEPASRTVYSCYLGILMTIAGGAATAEAAVAQLRESVEFIVRPKGIRP